MLQAKMKNDRQGGFTLIELMVALALAAILLAIGAPSFSEFIRNARIASASNDLLAGIHVARTEAIKRRVPVTLCASSNPTADEPTCDSDGDFSGWILFLDDDADPDVSSGKEGNGTYEPDSGEELLRVSSQPHDSLEVTPSTVYVQFGANGFQRRDTGAAPSDINIVICDSRGSDAVGSSGSAARLLEVSRTGRPRITRDVATIQTLGGCPADG
jgi:type IV fimbrial biogenesis protein FimT